jgi:hypothetical protein
MKQPIVFDHDARPIYSHLEPIVDWLLDQGNRLSHAYRWGADRSGYFCHFKNTLDFDLIEVTFDLPPYVRINRETLSIECDQSGARITGPVHSDQFA